MKRAATILFTACTLLGIYGAIRAPALIEDRDRRLITETVHEVLGQLHERGCGPVRFREAQR